ncbi:rds1 [Colletotrichum higginsianum]|nr:rds1 [Colletotrichum higginsianum]
MAPKSLLQHAGLLALASGAFAVPFVSKAQTTVTSEPTITASQVPHTNVTSHGPYTGPSPTTTGAISTSVLASAPAPYTPSGGIGTNGSAPVYRVQSDFDYQSLALALYQEYIELDLFHWAWTPTPRRTLRSSA